MSWLYDHCYQNIRDPETLLAVASHEGVQQTAYKVPWVLHTAPNFTLWPDWFAYLQAVQAWHPAPSLNELFLYLRWVLRTCVPDSPARETLDLIEEMKANELPALLASQSLLSYEPHNALQQVYLVQEKDEEGHVTRVAISYYADEAKALRDIRTVTSPEKWAARMRGASQNEARDFGAHLRTLLCETPTLHFATTIDDIQRVYAKGPSSCMQSEFNKIRNANIHIDDIQITSPVACYAAPNIAVAFIERQGRITGRCVVNTEHKEWARCYGDVKRLTAALDKANYTHNKHALVGCYIRHITDNFGNPLQPFVDWADEGYTRKDAYGYPAASDWGQLHVESTVTEIDGIPYRRITDSRACAADYENGFVSGCTPQDDENDWVCDYCDESQGEHAACYEAISRRGDWMTICEYCANSDDFTHAARGGPYGMALTHVDYVVSVDDRCYVRGHEPDHIECWSCGDNTSESDTVIVDGRSELTAEFCSHCVENRTEWVIDSGGNEVLTIERQYHFDRETNRRYTTRAYEQLLEERRNGQETQDEAAA